MHHTEYEAERLYKTWLESINHLFGFFSDYDAILARSENRRRFGSAARRNETGEGEMKQLLLGVAASVGLAAAGSAARAVPIDFTYSGSLVDFTVPATGLYQILAFGAQGGNSSFSGSIGAGGLGAEIGGDFVLNAGETLQIAVGGAGSDGSRGGAGGGGSFVIGPDNTRLVIAGGGGGGGNAFGAPFAGQGGLTGPDGGGKWAAPAAMVVRAVTVRLAVAAAAGFLVPVGTAPAEPPGVVHFRI